jgi:hypothetical protein
MDRDVTPRTNTNVDATKNVGTDRSEDVAAGLRKIVATSQAERVVPSQDDKNEEELAQSGSPWKWWDRRIDPIALVALLVAVATVVAQHIDSKETSERFADITAQMSERVGQIMRETVKETTDATMVGIARLTADQRPIFNGHEYKAPPGPIEIKFWTPSAKTKESVKSKNWEKMDNDQRLDEFAEMLIGQHILQGYRRYEIVGQGSKGLSQAGTWWVSSNDGNFDMKAFLKAYYEFWKPGEDSVYMEVTPVAFAYRPIPD